MFKIEPGKFKRTVDIKVPSEDGAEVQTIVVTFNVLSVSRSKDLSEGQDVEDFVHDTVAKIEGLVDEEGNPLTWNANVEAKFWDLPFVFSHIRNAYIDALEEARAKN